MKFRYTKRINITINQYLLTNIDEQVGRYKTSRSGLIRWALQEWLEAHPDPAKVLDTSDIDPEKSFKDNIKPGMRGQDLLDLLERYEYARKHRL